jgi:16S rRNA processing protein RimM
MAPASTGTSPDGWIRLGVVGRPHGVRGGVHLHLDNPTSTTLRAGLRVRLVGQARTTEHEVRKVGGGLLLLAGIDDRQAAEALTHATLEVPRAAIGDEVLLVDLLGRAVVDPTGAPLGRLVAFHDNGAQPVAEVTTARGESVLVPFVPPIVIDVGPPVVLAPPPGLFDDDAIVDDRGAAGANDDGSGG